MMLSGRVGAALCWGRPQKRLQRLARSRGAATRQSAKTLLPLCGLPQQGLAPNEVQLGGLLARSRLPPQSFLQMITIGTETHHVSPIAFAGLGITVASVR